jgi:hypothetical protein
LLYPDIDRLLISESTDRNSVFHAGANNLDPANYLFAERTRFAFGFGHSLEVSDLHVMPIGIGSVESAGRNTASTRVRP